MILINRSILHEVMEQQTLSIAKAGIICQLNARSSVLAAANPCGSQWDSKKTIVENIMLPHTLMSRFDLIFLMLDPQVTHLYLATFTDSIISMKITIVDWPTIWYHSIIRNKRKTKRSRTSSALKSLKITLHTRALVSNLSLVTKPASN